MVTSNTYAWTIINDYRAVDTADDGTMLNARGIVGPTGSARTHDEIVADPHARHFRLYGGGQLRYEGVIAGDFQGDEPLDDFGRPLGGCTDIQYLKPGPLWGSK
jgi:hypothetical protein